LEHRAGGYQVTGLVSSDWILFHVLCFMFRVSCFVGVQLACGFPPFPKRARDRMWEEMGEERLGYALNSWVGVSTPLNDRMAIRFAAAPPLSLGLQHLTLFSALLFLG
jgi:hypothetical protein